MLFTVSWNCNEYDRHIAVVMAWTAFDALVVASELWYQGPYGQDDVIDNIWTEELSIVDHAVIYHGAFIE